MTNDHGDDFQGVLKANFSSNIWYGADNTPLYNHLSTSLIKTTRYPEPNAESLQALIAKMQNLQSTQISIGNGSIDIIYRIAQAYRGKKSIIVSPTFSEYSKACTINQHTIKRCYRENLSIEIDRFQPDLVWLCNPNNPDGTCFDRKELQAIFYTYPQVTFIVDQSFVDFTLQETLPAISNHEFPNLILIYSLTKRFSIPGLRIGYVIASESIILQLNHYKIPWSVNTLAIEAGKFILSKQADSFDLKVWLTETIRFQCEIDKIAGFKTKPSQTPFFLVELTNGKAADLKTFLLEEGILIRDATNFENNGVEMIRLNTLSPDQNNLLISTLKAWNYNLSH
jgi:threonine-phosphate decarboxylase